jgi:hypothetical protein
MTHSDQFFPCVWVLTPIIVISKLYALCYIGATSRWMMRTRVGPHDASGCGIWHMTMKTLAQIKVNAMSIHLTDSHRALNALPILIKGWWLDYTTQNAKTDKMQSDHFKMPHKVLWKHFKDWQNAVCDMSKDSHRALVMKGWWLDYTTQSAKTDKMQADHFKMPHKVLSNHFKDWPNAVTSLRHTSQNMLNAR